MSAARRPALGRTLADIESGRAMRIVGGYSGAGARADFERALTGYVRSGAAAEPGRPDAWGRAALARLDYERRAALQVEVETLREALSEAEREIRGLKASAAAVQSEREVERADWERRIGAAERAGRHEAMRSARHGGRLPSILAVDRGGSTG